MATLSSLLKVRETLAQISETNLDQGRIFTFHPGTEFAGFRSNFCWIAPANGTAVIETWGASGSGGRMCCCGLGVPGNPGAYAKKTVQVNTSSFVSGSVGLACGNASSLCFRGCSQPTAITICTPTGCSCMCVQGGRGGVALCPNDQSIFCCFLTNGFCGTVQGSAGCGIICNFGAGFFLPTAYGGDTNCNGQFSCIQLGHCNSSCWCCHTIHGVTSAGIFGTCPATITASMDSQGSTTGFATSQYIQALAGLSKSPTAGGPYRYCYSSTQYCGCYEAQGCVPFHPTGIPGLSGTPCSSVRDSGTRGGMGTVRIRFTTS